MMLTRKVFSSGSLVRFLHQSTYAPASTKSNLAKLRKRTGFSFSNCKKALHKFDNDISKAESWLKEEAQKEGWSKATKLQGRATADGLIGVMSQGHQASMVEVNCETDFVARNQKFQHFVGHATMAIFKNLQSTTVSSKEVLKQNLTSDEMKKISGEDEKTLDDLTALSIGQVGENIIVKRAVNMTVPEDHVIGMYVHASTTPSNSKFHLGKYGALIVFKRTGKSPTGLKLSELGRRLGQHIVGMNPVQIGEYIPPTLGELEAKKPKAEAPKVQYDEDGEIVAEDPPEEVIIEDMVMQEYLFDPTITVGEMLLMEKIKVLDFARFACGEVEHNS